MGELRGQARHEPLKSLSRTHGSNPFFSRRACARSRKPVHRGDGALPACLPLPRQCRDRPAVIAPARRLAPDDRIFQSAAVIGRRPRLVSSFGVRSLRRLVPSAPPTSDRELLSGTPLPVPRATSPTPHPRGRVREPCPRSPPTPSRADPRGDRDRARGTFRSLSTCSRITVSGEFWTILRYWPGRQRR